MPHRVVPSNHGMNSMRKCVIKNAAVDLNSECDYGMKREEQKQPPISVDPADLGKNDVIGLIECLDESVKKSRREAVAMCSTELFFLSMTFFKRFLTQDARTFATVEKVDGRRIKVQLLSFDFASKFPKMLKSLPKDAALLSNY